MDENSSDEKNMNNHSKMMEIVSRLSGMMFKLNDEVEVGKIKDLLSQISEFQDVKFARSLSSFLWHFLKLDTVSQVDEIVKSALKEGKMELDCFLMIEFEIDTMMDKLKEIPKLYEHEITFTAFTDNMYQILQLYKRELEEFKNIVMGTFGTTSTSSNGILDDVYHVKRFKSPLFTYISVFRCFFDIIVGGKLFKSRYSNLSSHEITSRVFSELDDVENVKERVTRICGSYDRRLLLMEFLVRYRFHNYILSEEMESLARSIVVERTVTVGDIFNDTTGLKLTEVEITSRLKEVLELKIMLLSCLETRKWVDKNICELVFEFRKGIFSRSLKSYHLYIDCLGDFIKKNLKIIESPESTKNNIESKYYTLEGQNFMYDGQIILTVPKNLKFSYLPFGNDYCVTLNPYFSNKPFLIFNKKEIVSTISSSFIKDLGNGYHNIEKLNDTRGVNDVVLEEKSTTLYKWRRIKEKFFGRRRNEPSPKYFYRCGRREEEEEEPIFSISGGYLVDERNLNYFFWKDEYFAPKVPEMCYEYVVSTESSSLERTFHILYRQDSFLRKSCRYMLLARDYQILSDYSKCLDMVKKKITVDYYDPIRYPNVNFTSFSDSYQKYIINLMAINQVEECVFSKISRDVLIHKIVPYLCQVEVFFDYNWSYKNLIFTDIYNYEELSPEYEERYVDDLENFATIHPSQLCVCLVVLRRNLKDLLKGDEILRKLNIQITKYRYQAGFASTFFFGEDKDKDKDNNVITNLFHHLFVENEGDDFFMNRLRIELLKFLRRMKEKNISSDENRYETLDGLESRLRSQDFQFDINPLFKDISHIICNYDKKVHLQLAFDEKSAVYDLFCLLIGSRENVYNDVENSTKISCRIRFSTESQEYEDQKIRTYVNSNRLLSLDLINKFCGCSSLMKKFSDGGIVLRVMMLEIQQFFEMVKKNGFANIFDCSRRIRECIRTLLYLFQNFPKKGMGGNNIDNSMILDFVTNLLLFTPKNVTSVNFFPNEPPEIIDNTKKTEEEEEGEEEDEEEEEEEKEKENIKYPFAEIIFDVVKDEEAPFLHPMEVDYPSPTGFKVGMGELNRYVDCILQIFPDDNDLKNYFFPILNAFRMEWEFETDITVGFHTYTNKSSALLNFLLRSSTSKIISDFVRKQVSIESLEKKNNGVQRLSNIIFRSKHDLISSLLVHCKKKSNDRILQFITHRLDILIEISDILEILLDPENIFNISEEDKPENTIKVTPQQLRVTFLSQFKQASVHALVHFINLVSTSETVFSSHLFNGSTMILKERCRFLTKILKIYEIVRNRNDLKRLPGVMMEKVSTTDHRSLRIAHELLKVLESGKYNQQKNFEKLIEELQIKEDIPSENNIKSLYLVLLLFKHFRTMKINEESKKMWNFGEAISISEPDKPEIVFMLKENERRIVHSLVKMVFKFEDLYFKTSTPLQLEMEYEEKRLTYIAISKFGIFSTDFRKKLKRDWSIDINNDNCEKYSIAKKNLTSEILQFLNNDSISGGFSDGTYQETVIFANSKIIELLQRLKLLKKNSSVPSWSHPSIPFRMMILRLFAPQSPFFNLDLLNTVLEASNPEETNREFLILINIVFTGLKIEDRQRGSNGLVEFLTRSLIPLYEKNLKRGVDRKEDDPEYAISFLQRVVSQMIFDESVAENDSSLYNVFSSLSEECKSTLFRTILQIVLKKVKTEMNETTLTFIEQWDVCSHFILSQLFDSMIQVFEKYFTKLELNSLRNELLKFFVLNYNICENSETLGLLRRYCIRIISKMYTLDPDSYENDQYKILEDLFLHFQPRPKSNEIPSGRNSIFRKVFSRNYFEECEKFLLVVVERFHENGKLNDLIALEKFRDFVWKDDLSEEFVLKVVRQKLIEYGVASSKEKGRKTERRRRLRNTKNVKRKDSSKETMDPFCFGQSTVGSQMIIFESDDITINDEQRNGKEEMENMFKFEPLENFEFLSGDREKKVEKQVEMKEKEEEEGISRKSGMGVLPDFKFEEEEEGIIRKSGMGVLPDFKFEEEDEEKKKSEQFRFSEEIFEDEKRVNNFEKENSSDDFLGMGSFDFDSNRGFQFGEDEGETSKKVEKQEENKKNDDVFHF